LVDTSVWSLAFRKSATAPHPAVVRLANVLGKADIVLLGVILQEVLQAFRSESVFQRALRHLASFPVLQLRRSDYVAAARLHRTCADHGVSASTVDCQIAAAAIANRCALLSTDADFQRIAEYGRLRLVSF
jgi:predicted nucleic acid-binding protein